MDLSNYHLPYFWTAVKTVSLRRPAEENTRTQSTSYMPTNLILCSLHAPANSIH
ncbi:hypothetical protein [Pelagicoccus sp. SDUM812005]|uniref:hypothetical protein n=1 Tax=Pelagicoccus sp. SDUM812005 TaxID=3041257 RepID=UPI00280F6BE2|nr:hypothetical protein [Pelagicoccus sp. SDUM812005]MDQ8182263.1 hypothetical protein [Pelagicoccus sp. SDUM812005]